MSDTVLITGASGFIAQHIVKLLVSRNYNVIGTVRLAAKGSKLAQNVNHGSSRFTYVIVPDISVTGAFDTIFQKNPQISVVIHTALPFFYNPTNPEQDLIMPATQGTHNIMAAILKHVESGESHIRHVVVTSSDAALYSAEDEQNRTLSFDENSWNNITLEEAVKDPVSAYYGSKALAEKIAWQFAGRPGFPALTTVNPVYVFGPQAFDNEVAKVLNTSNEIINGLLKVGPGSDFVNDKGGFVDVRDVAQAHLAALEKENTRGKRLYMTNGHFSVQMMVDCIHEGFPELRGDVPVGVPGSGVKDIRSLATTRNDATRQILEFEFIPFSECVKDVVHQILACERKQKL